MWLATKDGFLSAVLAENGKIVVRSRERSALDHLDHYLPGLWIEETPGRDYRYRTYVGRDEFAQALAAMARDIDYPNFKDEVGKRADRGRVSLAYEHALHQVWAIFGRLQPDGPYGYPQRRRFFRGGVVLRR